MTTEEKITAKATGRILKDYRKTFGLKQQGMADKLKVSKSIWSKWENGLVNVPPWVPDAVRRLFTTVYLSELSTEEFAALYVRAKRAGKSLEHYIASLIRGSLLLPGSERYITGKVNEDRGRDRY